MWKAKTGESVDGVIAIDPIGLQSLIEVSGPVVVDGKLITKDNVVQETLLQSYLDYEAEPRAIRNSATRHRRRAASGRATSPGPWSTSSTPRAGTSRTWSRTSSSRPRVATSWRGPRSRRSSSGAGRRPGSRARSAPDSLLLAVQNRAGNKLDQFLRIEARLEHAAGRRRERRSPSGSTSRTRPRRPGSTSTSRARTLLGVRGRRVPGILSVNIPGVSRAIGLEGGSKIVAAGPDGPTRVIGTEMQVLRGEKQGLHVDLHGPDRLRARDDRAVLPVPGGHLDRRRPDLAGQQRPHHPLVAGQPGDSGHRPGPRRVRSVFPRVSGHHVGWSGPDRNAGLGRGYMGRKPLA